jgi:hypothetical protein
MDRGQLAPKPAACFPATPVSFTPRTAPGSLSRSSHQEVVPFGHQAARLGPIASRSEPNGAGRRQERAIPIGAFERSGKEAGKEWMAAPPPPTVAIVTESELLGVGAWVGALRCPSRGDQLKWKPVVTHA